MTFINLTGNAPNVINLTASPNRRRRTPNRNAAGPSQRRTPNRNAAGPSRWRNGNRRVSPSPNRRRANKRPRVNRSPELPAARPAGARNNGAAAARVPEWLRTRFGRFNLQPHQINACKLFARAGLPGLLLYYKVGSGKTLAAIACVENLARRERRERRVVVILPASLIDNFKKELTATGVDAEWYSIHSFNIVHRMTSEERATLGRNAVLVIDEAQNMRNAVNKPANKRTMMDSVMEVSRHAHKRVLLSGTPVMNHPQDIGPLLALVNPELEPVVSKEWHNHKARPTFAARFGRNASKDLPYLLSLMKCITLFYEPGPDVVRRHYPTKTEYWDYVPTGPVQTHQQFEMASENPGAATLHQLFQHAFEDEGEANRVPKSLRFLTGPRQVNNRVGNEHPKIDKLLQRAANDVADGGKCVVYSTYLESGLVLIASVLRRMGIPCGVYQGSEKQADKAEMVRAYNAGRLRVLLLSDAGKEGLDLKNTTQVHILEPAFNEDKIQQVIGRAVRFGSHDTAPKKHVDVYRYVSVLPPRPPRPPGAPQSVLFQKTADEILKMLSEQKNVVNKRFLAEMIRVSDHNLQTCV